MSKDQAAIKAVGAVLGLLGAAAAGGLAAVFSNMRAPQAEHVYISNQTGDDQEEETEEEESKQTGREQSKDSQQAEQAGRDQGDNERDDEDKERDQEEEEGDSEEETEEEESDSEEETEEEESDSEEETEEEESDSEEETEEEEEINQKRPGTIRIAVLNVRSMKKNASRIKRLLTEKKPDVFLAAETFLKHAIADRVLREASPEGFRSHYQVRADGRARGGVSNQFSEELQGEQIHFDSLNITTFEFAVTELQHDDWDQPVVIINLYRRPPRKQKKERFRRFLDEFESLLNEIRKKYSSFIVTGDFNIHVNKKKRSYTDEFYHVWPLYNLTQHVKKPTHRGGNTLDLVLTSNVEISDLRVHDDGISDHYTIYFNAKPEDTRKKTEENENEEQKRRKRN